MKKIINFYKDIDDAGGGYEDIQDVQDTQAEDAPPAPEYVTKQDLEAMLAKFAPQQQAQPVQQQAPAEEDPLEFFDSDVRTALSKALQGQSQALLNQFGSMIAPLVKQTAIQNISDGLDDTGKAFIQQHLAGYDPQTLSAVQSSPETVELLRLAAIGKSMSSQKPQTKTPGAAGVAPNTSPGFNNSEVALLMATMGLSREQAIEAVKSK